MPKPPPNEERIQHEPWLVLYGPDEQPGQAEIRARLAADCDAEISERAYVAPGARVVADRLHLGAFSYIAAGALVRGDVELGEHCTVNPYAVLAGRVRAGDGVRIASHVSIFGFNHVHEDPDKPIWIQGTTTVGIEIGDDVWIGTHVSIVDGVRIGAHSILAAGAVVTKDVPPYSVVVGNPGRVIRDRRAGRGHTASEALTAFATRAGEEWPELLERHATARAAPGDPGFSDLADGAQSLRAACDAIEIAAMFAAPEGVGERDEIVRRLQGWQDARTGLYPEPGETVAGDGLAALADHQAGYNVLCATYALECLDAAPAAAVAAALEPAPDALADALAALPWQQLAWFAGAWVDHLATCQYANARWFGRRDGMEALRAWCDERVDPVHGLWGAPSPEGDWLQPVNGFYRLTRGLHAQRGLPVPHPEAAIDSVLRHLALRDGLAGASFDACNVLDVVHPLWLCGRQTRHREAEIRDVVAALRARALAQWSPGRGFAFGPGQPTGLQGSEMWLAIVYLASAVLDECSGLGFEPRGVHRLAPALPEPRT